MTKFSLVIELAALKRAIEPSATLISTRPNVPILSHVLLQAEAADRLRSVATDMDRSTEVTVTAVSAQGETTLPGRQLRDILKNFAEGCQVSIEADASFATVRGGRSRARLPVLPAADFPPITPPGDAAMRMQVDGKALAAAIDGVSYAASQDVKSRYYLCGAHFHIRRGDDGVKLRLVATDGHRASWREITPEDLAGDDLGVTVPSEALSTLKSMAASSARIDLAWDAHRLRVETADTAFTTSLIDVPYADYQRFFEKPDTASVVALVDKVELTRAIDAALAIGTDKGRGVRFRIFADRVIVDRAEADSEVETSVRAEAEILGGDMAFPVTVGANGQYVTATMEALGAETVDLRLLRDLRLHFSRHGGADDPSTYALVLPQALRNGGATSTDAAGASERDAA